MDRPTHDSLYLDFINRTVGPFGVALHSYLVAIVGSLTVIVIMISCMAQQSVRKETRLRGCPSKCTGARCATRRAIAGGVNGSSYIASKSVL